jgi:tRNA threonylcarbamoyl adenosine modification protein YeaZ
MTEGNRWGIAIHTASAQLGLAKGDSPRDIVGRVWELGTKLSSDFHDRLSEFVYPLPWSAVRLLAVAIGPGGFTSTRIGVVAARTLAQQLDLPLFGYSTLAAAAWRQRQRAQPGEWLAVQMPARRGEWHGGIYEITAAGLVTHVSDRVLAPEQWETTIAQQPAPCVIVTAEADLGQDAIALLQLAQQDWAKDVRPHWSQVLPHYGQHPVDR